MRGSLVTAVLVGCGLVWTTDARAQVNNVLWSLKGAGDWNEDANWTGPAGNVVPDLASQDSAVIDNGGTALVSGGVPDVYNLSIGNGRVEFSGSAGLLVDHDLTNNGALRIAGPNVDLDVTGNYVQAGRLEAVISGASHSAIQVGGTADLGGTLAVQIAGPAPALGSSWDLVSAGQIVDRFADVDTTLAPTLPRGGQYEVSLSDTKASLVVRNSLVLSVDRGTGAVSLENPLGSAITIDGYAIRSAGGLLRHGDWDPLTTSGLGGAGWLASDESAKTLVELNPSNPLTLNVGAPPLPLGSPYAAGFVRPQDEDLVLEFTTPSGEIREGVVEFTGPVNDIVLAVDPTTGEAEIRNLSPFAQVAAAVDGYTIQSPMGFLTPATWTGLAGNAGAGPGWGQSPGNATGLAELNLSASTMFAEGTALRIGKIFDPTGLRDLVFEYAAKGSVPPAGDANADSKVDLTDFGILKENFGTGSTPAQGDFNGDAKVDLTDFGILKENFGKTSVPGEPDVFLGTVVYEPLPAAAVPEPSTLLLAATALAGLAGVRRRRDRNRGGAFARAALGGAGLEASGVPSGHEDRALTRMKMNTSYVRTLALVAATGLCLGWGASARAQDNEVSFGTLSLFTGGDAGEGLDLDGVFQYAVNVAGPGGLKVRDATFTAETAPGVSVLSDHVANPWGNPSSLGDTENDKNLGIVMNSIRWSQPPEPLPGVEVHLERLVPNADYKLQLLVAERCCNRAFDVFVDEELGVTEMHAPTLVGTPDAPNYNNVSAGVVYTHEFQADGETLFIELTGENTLHPDGNAILQGFTLEILLDQVGDFNLDSKVDLSDFGILRDNMLTGTNYADGDINFSGLVDLRDFVQFKKVFGSQAAAAPEPSSVALLGIGAWCLAMLRRRRR